MIESSSSRTEHSAWQWAGRASMSLRLQNLYALVQGVPLLGELARRVVAHALPHGTRVWAQTRVGLAKGLWLNLDPRFERHYAEGYYEPAIQKILAEKLSSGGTFSDAGGHIGFVSLIAARLVGDSGAVYSFEADPENAGRINQHV